MGWEESGEIIWMEKNKQWGHIFLGIGATVYVWIHGTGVSLIVLLAALIFAVGLVLNLRDVTKLGGGGMTKTPLAPKRKVEG